MKNESKEFEFKPKATGDRIYSGMYGDGTVVAVYPKKGRKRHIHLDGMKTELPDPTLEIKFDHHRDNILQYDTDVGLLSRAQENKKKRRRRG